MKNHYFSFRIFLQGLRLIRLPALILLISTLAFSLLQAISGYLQILKEASSHSSAITDSLLNTGGINTNAYQYFSLTIPTAVTIFATVGPLILTLGAFSFLRKRRASDFYHSIPVNRICLFFSYTLSVIVWSFAIILSGILSSATVYVIGGVLPLNSITLPYWLTIIKLLVGALSVIACTLLVMSITSNLFANLFMTAVVLYLPNFAFNLYTSSLASSVGNIISLPNQGVRSALGLLSYPFYSISAMRYMPYYLTSKGTGQATSWKSILLQAILTLLYFGLALIMFAKRKSEMADHGASTPLLQHICRVAVTLPFIAYFPVAFLSSKNLNIFALITLGILAFIVYFSYELIATRRFFSLVKATPVFLVVVGIAALGSLGLYAAKYNILSFSPNPEQVNSIQVTAGSTSYYSGYNNSYNYLLTSNIHIKDEKAKKIVCEALKANLKDIEAANYPSSSYSTNSSGQKQSIKVEFHTGLLSKTRIITLLNEECTELLIQCSETNEKFKKAMMAMPSDDEITSVSYSGSNFSGNVDGNFGGNVNAQDEDALKLFKIYRNECENLSVEQLFSLRNNSYSNASKMMEGGYFSITGKRVSGNFSVSYYLSTSLTPKTCSAVKDEEFKLAKKSFPNDDEITTISYCGSNINAKKEEALELYKIYRDECKNLSRENLFSVLNNSNIMVSGNFSITGKRIGGKFSAIYYVSNSLTPKTCAAVNSLKYKQNLKDLQGVLDHLNNRRASIQISNSDYFFDLFFNDKSNDSLQRLTSKDYNTVKKTLYDVLNRAIKSGSSEKNVWSFSLYYGASSQNLSMELSFTDDEIKTLVGIANRETLSALRGTIGKADKNGLSFQITNDSNNLYFSYYIKQENASYNLTKDELTKVSNILYKAFEHPHRSDNMNWNVSINLIESSDSDRYFYAFLYFTDSDIKYFNSLDQKYN